jgi:hypothetical protein
MTDFFASTRPGQPAVFGAASFELPILYFRDDLFALFFTADYQKAKALMPSPKLHPVALPGGRTMLGVAAFNYHDTSIGPYGEVGVILPAVYGAKPPLPGVPALLEARYPGFGVLVLHLPVTKTVARDAGRGQWGYTKFVADMKFTSTPEYHQCEMSDEQTPILTMRVAKRGMFHRDRQPLVTYSVKDGNLIKTIVRQKGACRMNVRPRASFLKLGDHPAAETIRALGIGERPIQSRYYVERSGILPAGEVIESGVAALDGWRGADREGQHTTVYIE